MIYLLHIDPPLRKVAHYLGCCAEDGLQKRLRQHVRGSGAALTRQAVSEGRTLYLARTFPGWSFDKERQMKRVGRFSDLCPICCPMFRPVDLTPHRIIDARPPQPDPQPIWTWTTTGKSV